MADRFPFKEIAEGSRDTDRLNWLEDYYTQTARSDFYWRQFMGQVAALGFRDAIDRAMSNPAPGVPASDGNTKPGTPTDG